MHIHIHTYIIHTYIYIYIYTHIHIHIDIHVICIITEDVVRGRLDGGPASLGERGEDGQRHRGSSYEHCICIYYKPYEPCFSVFKLRRAKLRRASDVVAVWQARTEEARTSDLRRPRGSDKQGGGQHARAPISHWP